MSRHPSSTHDGIHGNGRRGLSPRAALTGLVTLLAACSPATTAPDVLATDVLATDVLATDGGSADAARPDVPATDAGAATDAPGPDARDACEGRLLCDDFESATAGRAPLAPWHVSTNNGAVEVSTLHAFSGTRSVRVQTNAGQYKSALFYVDGAPVFPRPDNVVYGRMMMFMNQAANDGVHWTMIQGQGPLAGHAGVTSFYRYGGQQMQRLMANYETSGASTDCWDHSATVMPTGRWACFEWRFDGPNNGMRLWLDGTEITDVAINDHGEGCIAHDLMDLWPAPTFQRMSLGWESYQQDDAREAFIDDVILDDQRIGCPAP